ncbi:hypothetical protein COK65_30790 [Bacillus thuringiensis]|nr:hypothetical protein COK65_30790 [Bacillus thuringiensis]
MSKTKFEFCTKMRCKDVEDTDKLIADLNHLKENLKEAVEEEYYYSASDYIQRILKLKKELENRGVFF